MKVRLNCSLNRIQFGMWPSVRLRDGWGEVHTGDCGCKMPEHKATMSPWREIRMSPEALRFYPACTLSSCKSCTCALLMSDTWISCLAWPCIDSSSREGRVCTPTPFLLSLWMFNHRDILPQRPDLRQRSWLSKKSREPKQFVSP